METVLQGPDGKPAVDEQSGKPLTMEEMLRRRGIVRMGNTTSMIGPDSAAQGTPPTVTASTAASSALKSRAGGGSDPATASALAKTLPLDIKNATPEQAAQALASTNADPSTVQTLEGLGMVAAGTAAAYAIYKMRGQPATPEMAIREGMPAGIPEDAHFTDVGPAQINGPTAAQALKGRQQKALPAPAKKISASTPASLDAPKPSRSTTAQELIARAARGQPNDMAPIAGHAPIRTVSEPLDAGVARTVGASTELAKMLKANPGLLKTLTRIP